MVIPEVLEKWFVRVNGSESYLRKARGFSSLEPNKTLGFIFDNNLERMARLKAEGEETGKQVKVDVLMSEAEDKAMAEWLRNDMRLVTLRYRKGLTEEREEIQLRVRRNIECYAPNSAKVIFQENLEARLDHQGR